MGQFDYKKLVWGILYLFLAGFSCFFTAESLRLTWPLITPFFSWVMSIALFMIASLGGAMICKSFSRNSYVRRRGLMLSGGVIILLVVWLICCMPTNTHTLLFYNNINEVAQDDINNTIFHLRQLESKEELTESDIKAAQQNLEVKISHMLLDLQSEVNNKENPGFGPQAQKHLDLINKELGSSLLPLSFKTNNLTSQQKAELLQDLFQKVKLATEVKQEMIRTQMLAKIPMMEKIKEAATNDITSIQEWESGWKAGEINIKEQEALVGENGLDKRLQQGYGTIKTYKEFITFSSPEDEMRYTADIPTTKVKHMISVVDLWKDFLSGNLPNTGSMIFMIIISVLIDLSAFVFFYLLTNN